jgi:hypothetical protein
MINLPDSMWMSETDIEGTFFDPEYMLRHWEETRGTLWFWAEWAQPMYGPQYEEGYRK